MRTSVKEDIGVMSVFRHLASRCLHEIRRYEDEDDFRLYPTETRSPSVISRFLFKKSITNNNFLKIKPKPKFMLCFHLQIVKPYKSFQIASDKACGKILNSS